MNELRLWRLDRIASVDLLDLGFARREDFSLSAYAARSFGVFQEEPVDVVLRFAPEAAEDAAGWVFHPSQSTEREGDGGLIVRFRAGGDAGDVLAPFHLGRRSCGAGTRSVAVSACRVGQRDRGASRQIAILSHGRQIERESGGMAMLF